MLKYDVKNKTIIGLKSEKRATIRKSDKLKIRL